MNNPLQQWFNNLYDEFGDDVPKPEDYLKVIEAVTSSMNATPGKYLGSGDNGIAFLASDGDIIKFTIDQNEALLWHRLKSKQQPGITHLKDVANIASSKTGSSIIYVLKAEFAPNPVADNQAKLIRIGVKNASEQTQEDLRKMGVKRDKDLYIARRTVNLVKQFQKIADENHEFEQIPNLLMDLADKHGGHIYDLQPDNFRRKLNGEVVLVDPSVPDLVGEIQHPRDILYEDRLELALITRKIFY